MYDYRLNQMLIKFLDEKTKENISQYNEMNNVAPCKEFQSVDDIKQYFYKENLNIEELLTQEEIEALRYYTGIGFKYINSILRNKWNYEYNGPLKSEDEIKYRELAQTIKTIINKIPPITEAIKVYRGIPLSSFQAYGITNLNDLIKLRGTLLYDQGFTSTSLIKNDSFFDRELDYHDYCNVLIEYTLPAGSDNFIPLLSDELSYSKNQNELLINSSNLISINDVIIEGNTAILKAVYLPQKIWDLSLENNKTR